MIQHLGGRGRWVSRGLRLAWSTSKLQASLGLYNENPVSNKAKQKILCAEEYEGAIRPVVLSLEVVDRAL